MSYPEVFQSTCLVTVWLPVINSIFVPFLCRLSFWSPIFCLPKTRKNAKRQDSGNRTIRLERWEIVDLINNPDGQRFFPSNSATR